jgi:type IV secretory pathway TrbD component
MREPRGDSRIDPWRTGYRAPIYRAVWERILTWGAPRLFSALWVAICLYAVLLIITAGRPKFLILVALVWPAGQAVLALLTRWDDRFDEVILASPKYSRFYDAR